MEPFYYNKMNKLQQAVYHGMLQGINALDSEIQIPRIDGRELYDIFFQMRLDHPEVFWATGYQYRYYDNSSNLILLPEYLFDKNKIREHQKAMKARVEKLARAAKDLSEWEKEKYIHDFICENVTYDKLKKAYSHEIIGPLGHGVGVCEGIAKSVKVLCDALGIWCMIAICGNNPEKGIKLQAAKKGRLLTFHWRGGYLTKEVFQELLEQIKKAGDEKQKAARISVNWAQAVIRVSFVDAVEDACIDMEEANEGEQE